ncbi:hypothetical protein [Curtobacterium flaccumfaciens]|uniref:hypothetical protein n=1 Tax=Curtobacterium flaccumfaciens TaxID=2035 RepID=UPI00217EB109|nr:hypothetical protein [Curtobacterium flaccumfaciens]MCS6588211.1 hypothetical protein [Curtobacterium flaccumfaciens pv. flaccumfaciens]
MLKDMRERRLRKELNRNRLLVEALAREVDLRRTFVAERHTAMTTKASILVASASLMTALQSAGLHGDLIGWAIGLSAAAAVFGVGVLVPRIGQEPGLVSMEDNFWDDGEVAAIRNMTADKNRVLEQDERALFWRAGVVMLGFASLAASLAIAAIAFASH